MDELRCIVERITFQNEENAYTVLKCKIDNRAEVVTVVGNLPSAAVGSVLQLAGEWRTGKYGRQFVVQTCEELLPATVQGIEKYLGSGFIKGIGPVFAHKIVSKFGIQTLDVIEKQPERLMEIHGIGSMRIDQLIKSWKEQKEIKHIMVFLQSHGVGTTHASKIYKAYGPQSMAIVQENPYRLADDLQGIGFKTADTIAQHLGMQKDAPARLLSGLVYTLNSITEEGHCFALRDQLLAAAAAMLDTSIESLEPMADSLTRSGQVKTEDQAIYLPAFHTAETETARHIISMVAQADSNPSDSKQVMEQLAAAAPGAIVYDEIQLEAIRTAVESRFMVLTGGPGTGKTTTILGIIKAYEQTGKHIVCAAPTGRAAKRMSEATGKEARTIHRLLEFKPPNGYQRNADNPLDGDVLILDECSMIDIMLMHHLMKAVPAGMVVIMVGDIDQLPSVGAGNVLHDIIDSGMVPVVRLQRIFRQAQGSRIIMNAHRINQGKSIDISNGNTSDFFFLETRTPEKALEQILELVGARLPNYYHADAMQDIQVLTPMQRGPIGAGNLNVLLQEKLNPAAPSNNKEHRNTALGKPSLGYAGNVYRLHDKVMQIKNNYDKEVFNGDIGFISQIDLEVQELTITFEGRSIVYERSDLDEVVLAYATTIHKSQGSEYPIVVLPFMMAHFVMLQRNLLYTAVTRAKRALIIVGERKAIGYAIRNQKTKARNTRLAFRLQAFGKSRCLQIPSIEVCFPTPASDAKPSRFKPDSHAPSHA